MRNSRRSSVSDTAAEMRWQSVPLSCGQCDGFLDSPTHANCRIVAERWIVSLARSPKLTRKSHSAPDESRSREMRSRGHYVGCVETRLIVKQSPQAEFGRVREKSLRRKTIRELDIHESVFSTNHLARHLLNTHTHSISFFPRAERRSLIMCREIHISNLSFALNDYCQEIERDQEYVHRDDLLSQFEDE